MPTLSEASSKELLGAFGVPFPAEQVVATADAAVVMVLLAVVAWLVLDGAAFAAARRAAPPAAGPQSAG